MHMDYFSGNLVQDCNAYFVDIFIYSWKLFVVVNGKDCCLGIGVYCDILESGIICMMCHWIGIYLEIWYYLSDVSLDWNIYLLIDKLVKCLFHVINMCFFKIL